MSQEKSSPDQDLRPQAKEEQEPLQLAAEAIADGAEPKLDQALADSLSEEERRVLVNLERIAGIQAAFHSLDADTTPLLVRANEPGPATQTESFTWGHLQTLERIGSGSYGDVYRAYDRTLQRDVALKLRRLERHSDTTKRDYIEEARRLARVRHPNVLAVHGAEVHDGRVGLWSDLLSGETLEHLLARRTLSKSELLDLGSQLAAALEAVHKSGLVHGDVKASNVMIEADGTAVLMDFGAGYELASSGDSDSRAGSPLSMAPELFDGGSSTPRSDIYSLGVLLHRLITGRYPIEAKSLSELRDLHQRRDWKRDRVVGVDRDVSSFLSSLLAPEPSSRPSAAEVLQQLGRLREAPARRRRRIAVAAVMASLTLGVVAASTGLLISRNSAREANRARLDAESATEFLTDVLSSPGGTQQGINVRVIDTLENAVVAADHRLADRPILQARVHTAIASVYHGFKQCEEAVRLYERAATTFSRELGPDSVRHIDALFGLGRCQIQLEPRNRETFQRAFDLALTHPPDSQIRIYATIYRAEMELGEGQIDSARTLLDEALLHAPIDDGEPSPERVFALRTLGRLEATAGNYVEARRVLQEALAACRSQYGDRDTRTLATYRELGRVLDRMGLPDEAIPILERARDVAVELVGERSPVAFSLASAVANNLYSAGRVEEALEINRKLVAQTEERPGEGSEEWLTVSVNLASQLKEVGRSDEAEALYRRCVELSADRSVGESSGFIARFNLAEMLYEQGRYREAARFADDGRSRLEGLPPGHLFVIVVESLQGAIDVARGNVDRGAARIEKVLERASSSLGPEHPSTLEVQAAHAVAWRARGEPERAEALLEKTLEQRRKILGEDHYRTRESAALLESWRRSDAP